MVYLIPALVLALGATSIRSDSSQLRSIRQSTPTTPAFFEFAPASGAGMGAACACATPTGAKGETMTFTRASSATCLKTVGAAPQTIANGDLVTCTSGQARVMPGTDGTSVNGLLVESSRTNVILQNQHLENAAWTLSGVTSAAPTVTADFAVAPDGTTTADRVQFAACASVDTMSVIYQIGFTGALTYTGSTLCRGTSADQTISMCTYQTGGTPQCQPVTCPAAGWRQVTSPTLATTSSAGLVMGCQHLSSYGGSSSTGTADVLLWDSQLEVGSYATSPIATTSAAVTRSADVPYLALTLPVALTWSMASSVDVPLTPNAGAVQGLTLAPDTGTTNRYKASTLGAGTVSNLIVISSSVILNSGGSSPFASVLGATDRLAGYYDGATTAGICLNGSCTTATISSFTPLSGSQRIYVGASNSAVNAASDGVVKRVCFDQSFTRCL